MLRFVNCFKRIYIHTIHTYIQFYETDLPQHILAQVIGLDLPTGRYNVVNNVRLYTCPCRCARLHSTSSADRQRLNANQPAQHTRDITPNALAGGNGSQVNTDVSHMA